MDYTVEDFMRSVVPSDVPFRGSPCWLWVGRLDSDGYGWLPGRHGARSIAGPLAHRFAYVVMRGQPLLPRMVIDHLCRQRSCVNPAHLRAVTNRENVVEAPGSLSPSAANALKTHCQQGHEFTEENTKRTKAGHRVCRTCEREYQKAYQRRRRQLKLVPSRAKPK
jgi:hypothetical protein